MEFLKFLLVVVLLVTFPFQHVHAETIDDIKDMMVQMKSDYEKRIMSLEEKIENLSAKQAQDSAKLEVINATQGEQQEALANTKSQDFDVAYVGRGNASVGRGGVEIKNPFGFGNVSVGGYMDVEYADFEKTTSNFLQHRWIINIGAFPHERLRFNSELEIEYGGPNAPNSDGELKVEQAYVDYLINDTINVRAGALLVPFGRYNLYHDSDLQKLTDRPIMARDIVPTTWTEAGAGFFGKHNPTIGAYEDLQLAYEMYVVNGLDAGFSDTGLGGGRSSLKVDNNDNKAVVGRVTVSPWLNQEFGFSGYTGRYDGDRNRIHGFAVDTLNTVGPFELINEYAYFDVEQSHTDVANYFQGAYAQLSYKFWPKFLDNTFLGEGFKDPNLALVGRYDWALIGDDQDSGSGNNEETRWTLGFNYRPIDNFVFKLEYQWNKTDNETLERGNNNGILTSVAIGF